MISCFKDYLAAFSDTGKSGDKKKDGAVRFKCLSKEFNKKWKANLDADALLSAQDLQESWKTNQRVKNLDLAKSTASVVLGLGSEECFFKVHRFSSLGSKSNGYRRRNYQEARSQTTSV